MSRYRVQTGGRYIVKGGEQVALGQQKFYSGKEINGWYSPAHRIVVTDTKTSDKKVYFPGEKIVAIVDRPKKKKVVKKEADGKAQTFKTDPKEA